MIDYKHRYEVLTTPNKEGLIPYKEIIKIVSKLDFKLTGLENKDTLRADQAGVVFWVHLNNGDVELGEKRMSTRNIKSIYTPNQIAIVRKWDDLGIDFTKEDWKIDFPDELEIDCIRIGCDRKAVTDYNGNGCWLCKRHNDKMEREFDENFR